MREVPLHDVNNYSICYSVILDSQGLLANKDTQLRYGGPMLLVMAMP